MDDYSVNGAEAKAGFKLIKSSKKIAWYIYMPGKNPTEALWAFGNGKTPDSNLLKTFQAHAKTQTPKRAISFGNVHRVTIDDVTVRVFEPRGKAPSINKLSMDALFGATKASVSGLFPKEPMQIIFNPDMPSEDEEEEVVRGPDPRSAKDKEEDQKNKNDAKLNKLRDEIRRVYKEAQKSYDALVDMDANPPELEEILMDAEVLLVEIEELSAEKGLYSKTESELKRDVQKVQGYYSDLNDLGVLLEHAQAEYDHSPETPEKQARDRQRQNKKIMAKAVAKEIPVKIMEAKVKCDAFIYESDLFHYDYKKDKASIDELIAGAEQLDKSNSEVLDEELKKIGAAFDRWETALNAQTINPAQLVSDHVNVVAEIRKEGWEGLKEKYGSEPEKMKEFFNFRRVFVDQTLVSLRSTYPGVIWKSVGSMSLTSDYDITITVPGAASLAAMAVRDFNTQIRNIFGKQPGTAFDTNLYVKDFVSVKGKGRGAGAEDHSPPQPKNVKMMEAGQDTAALLKQRRFMIQSEYDALMRSTLTSIEASFLKRLGKEKSALSPSELQKLNKLLGANRKQFETADAQYKIAQAKLAEKLIAMQQDPARQKEVTEKLAQIRDSEEHIAALAPIKAELNDINNAIAEAELDTSPDGAALLAALRAEKVGIETRISTKDADLIRENGGDLALEASNDVYLDCMHEVYIMEQELEQMEKVQTTDEAAKKMLIEGLKSRIRDKTSEATFFASEAYQTEGAVEHVVQGMQGDGKLDNVSIWQFLESFNENVGDFMKDMKHYAGAHGEDELRDMGKAFYKSSKYVHRLLDTVKEIKKRFNSKEVLPFETSLGGDSKALADKISAVSLAIRKGALEFEGGDLTDEEKERAKSLKSQEQMAELFKVGNIDNFVQKILKFAKEVNAWVRVQEMERVAMASPEEEAAYFNARD